MRKRNFKHLWILLFKYVYIFGSIKCFKFKYNTRKQNIFFGLSLKFGVNVIDTNLLQTLQMVFFWFTETFCRQPKLEKYFLRWSYQPFDPSQCNTDRLFDSFELNSRGRTIRFDRLAFSVFLCLIWIKGGACPI